MPHNHSHALPDAADRRLVVAVALNLLLSAVEVVAGVLSGSLALVADAVHNFNDCASLVVALVARRIARRPSDQWRTFGYRRAETIGALVNLTALALVGLFLVYEAVHRLFVPHEIEGWTVIVVALAAVAINLTTAGMLHGVSRANLNLQAAFLHNLGDAMSSAGVIVAGAAVLLFQAQWVDVAVTLAIAGVLLWQCFPTIARSIHVLLESVPPDIDLHALVADLHSIAGVQSVHHVHVWEMDEEHRALEAHIVVDDGRLGDWAQIKGAVKTRLRERYRIHHSTLEFETIGEKACADCGSAQPN
jgi:cobalt-zinc-cadmium efflux system protein